MIKSAISSDLFTWTVESGVRIGPGSDASGNAEHPCAILDPTVRRRFLFQKHRHAALLRRRQPTD